MTNMTKTNEQKLEVGMQQFDLYRQMVFKGFESFAYQSQENLKGKQKQLSKINKVGRKLPKIGKNEYFKFNSKVDFSMQRRALHRVGASEVGSLFMGADYLEEMFIVRILKSIGREMPFEDNLSIKKGKALENLIIDEFVKIYDKNIHILHKNKYSNGIDKYNYFKKVGKSDCLVGATIDAWFVNGEGDAELLEIKCSDSFQIQCGASEYNRIGNFLDNKYFFKYYVQVQMQLLCTGLKKGNLFFLYWWRYYKLCY
ncbi:YqaJ viral recombinase family protein [Borrelia puertoricensis]|uniref:YqaJ viral recombinase family protein n=1 Tax=Borrelia puertoricensis TaxID=2756107 RepID=UPI001FF196ED|nr:YqaJ viral recombinase family protein [Borrelia puertoricensis]